MDALRSHVQPANERFEHDPPFRIGGASIDPSSREVTINGERERIQPQPLRVLMLLHRRKGRVVTRDEIVEQCWDRRIVGDDVINRAILILRRVAERAGGFRIETIPRAGYRLVDDHAAPATWRRKRLWLSVTLLAVLVAVLIAAVFVRTTDGRPPDPSVAVLPITAPAGDRTAGALGPRVEGAVRHVLVESGFSAASPDKADFQISGDVERVGHLIRITMRMEERKQKVFVMSRLFERPADASAGMPDEIAANLAATLGLVAAVVALDRDRSTDPKVLREVLQSAYAASEGGDPLRAYQIAKRAARAAPDSAAVQISLAMSAGMALALGDLPVEERSAAVALGRPALARSQALAPQFEGNAVAWCMLHPRVWFRQCEQHLRAAVNADPDASIARLALSMLVGDMGQLEEALRLARIASANDPYDPAVTGQLLQLLEIVGRHREAEEIFAAASRSWPENWALRWNRIMGLSMRGDFQGLKRFIRTIPQSEATFDADAVESIIAGYETRDAAGVRSVCRGENLRGSTRHVCIAVLAALGDLDESFAMADTLYPRIAGHSRAEDERLWLERPGGFTLTILSAPAGAALRRDPRFAGLANQSGLARYWRGGTLPDFCRGKSPEPVCQSLQG